MQDQFSTYTTFDEKLAALAAFKEKHGHCNVPKNYKDHPKLAKWVSTWRSQRQQARLNLGHEIALIEMGFAFKGGLSYGVEDVKERLKTLAKFRAERKTTGLPTRTDENSEYVAMAQWIYRMRRGIRGDVITDQVKHMLEVAGIQLEHKVGQTTAMAAKEHEIFMGNIDLLSMWLDQKEEELGQRNLTYKDSRTNEPARKPYRFIEHMILKTRQGSLSDEHRAKLYALAFSVNGKPIDDLLKPMPSIRSEEASAIKRAQHVVGILDHEVGRIGHQSDFYRDHKALAGELRT